MKGSCFQTKTKHVEIAKFNGMNKRKQAKPPGYRRYVEARIQGEKKQTRIQEKRHVPPLETETYAKGCATVDESID